MMYFLSLFKARPLPFRRPILEPYLLYPFFAVLSMSLFDEVRCPIRSIGHMLKEERGARCAAPPHAYSMKGTTFL